MKVAVGLSVFVTVLLTTWIGYGVVFESGLEGPKYKLLEKKGSYSIREYDKFLLATTTTIPSENGLSSGFRELAGYIFGNNDRQEKMEMTAPVIYTDDKQKRRFSFVMPASFSKESLPVPDQTTIDIETFVAGTFAVYSFRGGVNESKIEKYESKLQGFLLDKNLESVGEVIVAQYNSPFVFPLLRRNEIWLRVQPRGETSDSLLTGQ